MAAMIKALNAKIRSNPTTDYLCSTHFWGPASNFGIPIAAVMDTQKDPEVISGPMTTALVGYSAVFMRYSMAVTPKNYLLFGCHLVNFSAQSVQGYRFINWWYMGGRDKTMEAKAKEGLKTAEGKIEGLVGQAQEKLGQAGDKVQGLAEQAKEKISR